MKFPKYANQRKILNLTEYYKKAQKLMNHYFANRKENKNINELLINFPEERIQGGIAPPCIRT